MMKKKTTFPPLKFNSKLKLHIVLKLIALIFPLLLAGQVNAQFVDFGRNKVQYSDFDWHTISTKHFKVFYYKEEKELAEMGAKFAEDSYEILQQKFKYSLIDTVPIIFYSSSMHFKQTNTTPGLIPDGVGGFFEFIKGRVVIPFDGSLGNFKHVIRHELTHVFMTSKVLNQLKSYGKIQDRMPPLWFVEGLAEYWSTDWDTQAEMVFKDAMLSTYGVGLVEWEKTYGNYLMYKLGQKVLEYIADKYGEEKVLELIDNFWIDDDFSLVMKYTIGKDYKEFDKEFLPYMKAYYQKEKSTEDVPTKTTQNIYSKAFGHKPVYTNFNGLNEVFFIGDEAGYTSVYRIKVDEKDASPELFIEGENSDEFEAFHFFRTGMDISNTGQLAFITQKGESDAIHIFDITTGDDIADYSFMDIVGIGSPAWSKDSKKIVFPGIDFSGKSDLYIFDIETETLTRLTNDYYDDRDPDISPDGNFVVFASDRTSFGDKNKYNLFLYNLTTNDIEYLTIGNQTDYSPGFSDDGNKIIFTSDLGGAQNIWMIDFVKYKQSTNPEVSPVEYTYDSFGELEMRRLTNFTTAAYDPRWSGEDNTVFTVFQNGKIGVRLLDSISMEYDSSKFIYKIDYNKKETIWIAEKEQGLHGKEDLKYAKDFSMDLATTSITTDPVFGTNAGGVISLSDMLGNEKYYFLIFNNSDMHTGFWKSFNVAVSKVSLEERLNYAYGIFHLSGRRYDIAESDQVYYERMYGGYISMSYPLSFFRRIETSTSLSQSVKDVDITDYRRSLLLSNSVSYVKDNAIWGYTGPLDGERFNATLGYTTDIQNSNENFYSVLIDYRKYFRIAGSTTFATRAQWFMNEGKNPRRFYMGGSWSLRGWPFQSMKGTKMWQTNAEFRFPIFNIINTKLPLGLNYIFPVMKGAVFFDAGSAFDTFESYKETYGSIGAGLRLNMFGFLVIRYDVGKRIEKNFTHIQEDLFSQLFFGWDF